MMLRVLVVLAIASLASSNTLNEKRPELGQYQDDGKCFPLKTSWHMMYRSFETDPFFGNTAKCARITGTSPVVNGSTEANIEFSPDKKSGIKIELISSDGYTHKNVLRVSLKSLEESFCRRFRRLRRLQRLQGSSAFLHQQNRLQRPATSESVAPAKHRL
uniref:Putative lipocal-1 9 n=1 Tax=Ixodes ricinus TaxID=34613 RepID=V5IBJ5_IXORI